MCGLVGFSGAVDARKLNEAVTSIGHRGPDSSGLYVNDDSTMGLGHTRLSILDLSSEGHQPMISDDETVVLAFNGEIYNFLEIRKELVKQGYQFKGNSDTEVILKSYLSARKNNLPVQDMLRSFNGMFSIALWDSSSETMLLARDAFGVKPLYYCQSDTGVSFASEIKALKILIGGFDGLDHSALENYISFLWYPGNCTPIKNVKKIGPGELFFVRAGKIIECVQWSANKNLLKKKKQFDPKNGIIETAQLLRKSVHRQMVADVPVGAFLSGGVDSSSIVAFAKELNPSIKCFSIHTDGALDEGVDDDLPFARIVAKHLGVALEVVEINSSEVANDLEDMVYSLDEPLADIAALNVFYISRFAREQGIKVMLSGNGGDELFAGYRRHQAISLSEKFSWVPSFVDQKIYAFVRSLDQRSAVNRKLTKMMRGKSLEGDDRLIDFFRWSSREDIKALFSRDFFAEIDAAETKNDMPEFLENLEKDRDSLERMLALDQRFFLTDHNLTYTDKMSMSCGVETRVPFLDNQLVDFARSIPSEFKLHGRQGKWILKKAMEPYLPKSVIYRKKAGFGVPLRRWMRHELRNILCSTLSPDRVRSRGLFDPNAVQKLIESNDRGEVDASYTLLSLMCIELWCKRFC